MSDSSHEDPGRTIQLDRIFVLETGSSTVDKELKPLYLYIASLIYGGTATYSCVQRCTYLSC